MTGIADPYCITFILAALGVGMVTGIILACITMNHRDDNHRP